MKLRMERRSFEVKVEHNGETGIFEVEPMTPEESTTLLKKHTPPKKWIGQKMVEHETDWMAMKIDKVKKTIVEWEVVDEKGKKVECTAENKKIAYLLNPALIGKVLEKADELGTGIQKDEAEAVKNS